MKVIEFLEKANKTLFSYEIIPPIRGGSIEKIFNLLNERSKSIKDSKILVLGLSYKKNNK